jgi:putative transposase
MEPRIVRPGDVVLSTVRTVARFYLLRPCRELHDAILYVLGHYAELHGVVLHAACVMSTHIHLVYQDRLGLGPLFVRDVDRSVANLVKALHGWRGSVFQKAPNHVRLLTPDAIADKVGYVAANPVAAGAVRYARDWPGLNVRVSDIGRTTFRVKRPAFYFDPEGKMPGEVEVHFELPEPLVRLYGEEPARARLRDSVAEHEAAARAQVHEKGWSFLGADRCSKLSPYRRAKAYEVFGGRHPTFATKGGGRKAFLRAVAELRAFRRAYREALARWRRDDRAAIFPCGTFLMRVLHGVTCVPWAPA